MTIICLICRRPMRCIVSAAVHIITEHERRDIWISPDLVGDDGKHCLPCMLKDLVPIEKLWKAKGII